MSQCSCNCCTNTTFPDSFLNLLKDSNNSWLCTNGGVTYQTKILVSTSDSTIATVGILEHNKGKHVFKHYEIATVTEITDAVTNKVMFTVKLKGTVPAGLTVTLIPIKYSDTDQNPLNPDIDLSNYYTKEEVDTLIVNFASKTDTGDIADLTTTNKNSLVQAINEIDAAIDNIQTKGYDDTELRNLIATKADKTTTETEVGDLTGLTTTSKDSLVSAINEIKQDLSNVDGKVNVDVVDDLETA